MNQLRHNMATVEITDVALPNNYGVAKEDGLVIFVPDAVPGDRVRVRIIKESKRFAYGEIVEMLIPSPFRVSPECPHFGPCGGCTFQNFTYEKQLEIKENYLLQTLKRIGGLNTECIKISPIIPSPDIFFYRNKLELSFGNQDGSITLGLRERVSPFKGYEGNVIPLKTCLISSHAVEKIIPLFAEFAKKHGLAAYNPLTGHGFLRHLILRESKTTGELMAILETKEGIIPDLIPPENPLSPPFPEQNRFGTGAKGLNPPSPPFIKGGNWGGLWQALTKFVPEIKSLYRIINNKPGDDFHPEKSYCIAGKPYIEETLNNIKFRVFPESFFQPNTKSAEILYRKIVELTRLEPYEKVLGLYCGAGPIEISLSQHAKEVIGIDSTHTNIINARENCRLNGIKNCLFYEGKIETVLNTVNLKDVDLLIVDPPRAGISKKGLEYIFKLHPQKIGYVSCNPSTLARDLKILQHNHYHIISIIPFDFFPHTSHLETLATLAKFSDSVR